MFSNDLSRPADEPDSDVEDDDYAALARKYGALDDEPAEDDD